MSVPAPKALGNGIYMIPAPLPFKSPEWVNIYAIEAEGGLLLIDCGTDWEPGREAIKAGFAALGLDETAVHTLLVSHLHPDHVGMSARLVREWGCRFVMHERAARLVDRYNDTPGYARRLVEIAKRHGVPGQVIASTGPIERADYMPLIDPPDHLVADGDEITLGDGRALHVIYTPGHDQAHICLRDSRTGVTFSGDHVLPRISPVIMYDLDLVDPLGEYLDSLRRLIDMGIGLTYPAHGTIIERGDERAHQIILHHDRRLRDMAELVRAGETNAWNVMLQSFRPNLDPLSARLAFLETISHLEHLRSQGRILAEDKEGTVRYRV
ncbi:MAG TPA: MBL fold metallo-hydrolase [Acidimicrobiia bacterium]|jgi:glyoxylase-like metal-dependent hydrolase (beta-lactamase superfamily II)|nr:MBL fold metallo-hydrolase [Acidimicrobiia bacterium]